MDKCTRTTTEDALTHKPQETYDSCIDMQRTEEAEESMTSIAEAAERKRGVEAHLYVGNPSTSINSPMLQSAMGEIQMNKLNPIIVDTTMPSFNDLCTQLESLTINKREEVINHLCIA